MKDIGLNIKKRREQMGLTLRELALNVGVSASFLSQVECGKVSPSLATLKKIVGALNTTVGAIIGEKRDINDGPVVRVGERKTIEGMVNKMMIDFLTSSHPDKMMEPMIFRFSESGNFSDTMYQHFGQEFVLVLKGKIEIVLGNERYVLEEGDSIYFNSGVPHAFWNAHSGISEALSINTPPNF
jgi:transcriptional regulator with XRE-family HTH domain